MPGKGAGGGCAQGLGPTRPAVTSSLLAALWVRLQRLLVELGTMHHASLFAELGAVCRACHPGCHRLESVALFVIWEVWFYLRSSVASGEAGPVAVCGVNRGHSSGVLLFAEPLSVDAIVSGRPESVTVARIVRSAPPPPGLQSPAHLELWCLHGGCQSVEPITVLLPLSLITAVLLSL